MLDTFEAFMEDEEAPVMYVTGVAGTGKTTSLGRVLQYCIDNKIHAVTVAYTHKATMVLRSKLPKENDFNQVCTLHSFLRKVPTINDQAIKLQQVEGNAKTGVSKDATVLFVDEFSMIGEKDFVDINDLQFDDEGNIKTKVVYIGDPNQLPPVKDVPSVIPSGKYWVKLTKIYRQADGNKLLDILHQLNDFINGEEATALTSHENFIRGVNIVDKFKNSKNDKVILAYTNAQVQELNAQIEGKTNPDIGDTIYTSTLRKLYTLEDTALNPTAIVDIRGNVIERNSKYKTLETLIGLKNVEYVFVKDEQEQETPRAMVFGHANYNKVNQDLMNNAVSINKIIKNKFDTDPKAWAQENYYHELAKDRSKAWREYLAFKSCVLCMDFAHAMTIHKSQGSTYEEVYLDMDDIGKCARSDYQLYLKLLYVGISRASNIVYTN